MATRTSTAGSLLKKKGEEILDGSDIMKLVENKELFSSFVDHKFNELDKDSDGQLSVNEVRPAVADIGAALGLPAQGSSPASDHIYSEVLNEFTRGKRERVSKSVFKEVLSDRVLKNGPRPRFRPRYSGFTTVRVTRDGRNHGMAASWKRDPIVILRIDGEDLLKLTNGPSYEVEMVSIFQQIAPDDAVSLRDCILKAFEKLSIDHGVPPCLDSWVISNIIEPTLQSWSDGNDLEKLVSQETFLEAFKKVAECVAKNLKGILVFVAHSENTFDGSGIKRILSNKFELDKSLNIALNNIPKDCYGKVSKEYLRAVLGFVGPSAGLPPVGEVEQVVADAFDMVNANDGKMVKEDEFKKLLTEILGSIMLQLEGNPVSISSNSVVHESLASSSSLLQPLS